MPSNVRRYVYWDACVFLAYLNNEPNRGQTIADLWEEIRRDKENRVITSTISVVEVAFARVERTKSRLDHDIERAIDAF